MYKITLENTSIELGFQSNDLKMDYICLTPIEGTQWCALMEGSVYNYRLEFLNDKDDEELELSIKGGDKGIIKPNSIHNNSGAIHTNTYVGNLFFEIKKGTESQPIDSFYLKVHSVKVDYEEEYQYMLEEIAVTCADLLLRASSPVNQFLTVDHGASSTSDYQRFKFIESLILSEDFDNALSQILFSPDVHLSSITRVY